MSRIRFELNINKYTPQELEELLKLKYPYTNVDIENKVEKLKAIIKSDTSLNNKQQQEFAQFLGLVNNAINKHLLDIKNKIDKNEIQQYDSNIIISRNTLEKKNPDGIPPSVKINPYRTGPGDIVSMLSGWKDDTLTKVISLDSRFRSQYFESTSTDFLIDLPITLNKVVSMTLVALELPATYFQISKRLGNNFFHIYDEYLNLIPAPTGHRPSLFKITIPDGHYSREEMQTVLNQQLKATDWVYPTARPAPEASIDEISGRVMIYLGVADGTRAMYFNMKSTIGENGPYDLQQEYPEAVPELWAAQPIQSKLGWILGYRLAIYDGRFGASTLQPTFVSEGIYDGWGSRYFYFIIDDFNKNSIKGVDAVLNSSVLGESILARITQGSVPSALNVGFTLEAALLKDNEATRSRIYTGPVTLKKLRIKILDAYGRVIDLNNMDISFSLKFLQLYD